MSSNNEKEQGVPQTCSCRPVFCSCDIDTYVFDKVSTPQWPINEKISWQSQYFALLKTIEIVSEQTRNYQHCWFRRIFRISTSFIGYSSVLPVLCVCKIQKRRKRLWWINFRSSGAITAAVKISASAGNRMRCWPSNETACSATASSSWSAATAVPSCTSA